MDDQKDTDIQEGEIISQAPNKEDNSAVLTSLDELIKTYITSIDRLREEQHKLKEMLEDGFRNSPTFKEASDKVKQATKIKSEIRQQILKQPAVAEMSGKIKNINTELKEKQMALSDYLLEYQRLSGANQIEMTDGEVREITLVAKLIKKTTEFRKK